MCNDDFVTTLGGVFRDRRYRRFVAARVTSVLGSTMAPIALAFAVLQRDPGAGVGPLAGALGAVMIARMLALVLFSLWGGVIADRLSRRGTMIASDLVAGASQGLLAVLVLQGRADLTALVVLTFVNSAASAVFGPASDGMLPLMLPREALKDAQALMMMAIGIARIAGAAGAGLLIAVAGPGGALLVDAATFFVSAALLGLVSLPKHVRATTTGVFADLRHGWREFVGREWIWVTVLQVGLINFFLSGGIFVLGPIIAEESLGGGAAWAVIVAAQAAGFLAGSTTALRITVERPVRLAVIATFAYAPPFFLLALGAPLWAVAVGMFFQGLAVDLFGALWMSVFLTRVPEESMSRISSYDQLSSMVLVPLGFAAVGPLAIAWGTRPTLLVYGAVVLAITAVTLLSADVRRVTALLTPRTDEADAAIDLSDTASTSQEPPSPRPPSGGPAAEEPTSGHPAR